MELNYARYLQDEGLREELERRAHQARAEEMHRFFAQSTEALLGRRARAPQLQPHACG
ncbi:MAG TPA: hypothetical protein VF262_01565 [Burkholderiales bacterium]